MNLNFSETKCETSELRFKSGVKRNSKECFKLGEVAVESRNVRNIVRFSWIKSSTADDRPCATFTELWLGNESQTITTVLNKCQH